MNMSDFKDQVVIVTGGGSGIGSATVSLFLEQGARVASLDIREPKDAATDENRFNITSDISSEDSVNQAIKQIVDKWGTVDVLVNCAGVMDNFDNAGDTTNDTWNKCLNINLNGPFYLIRSCLPHFQKAKKGSIVNVCSVASVRGAAAGAAYTVSKHGLLGLSRNTAWMYGKEGIRCNAVIPGGVHTGILQNSEARPSQAGYAALGPYLGAMPGISQPVDLANAILFLAKATNVNGAELAVDAGWTTA